MLSGKLGIRYTYPKGIVRPFAELGLDVSGMVNAKIKTNDKSERWLDGVYPGYYANAGINFKTFAKEKANDMCACSIQGLRDMMEKSASLMAGQE